MIQVTGYNPGLIMRLLTGAGTPREFQARGSAICSMYSALLAIIAFADQHPVAVRAVSFEADPFS
jgi:transposase